MKYVFVDVIMCAVESDIYILSTLLVYGITFIMQLFIVLCFLCFLIFLYRVVLQ